MIVYLVTRAHAYTMTWFLQSRGAALADRIAVLPYEALFAGTAIPRGAGVVFSDLDQLTPAQRERLGPFHDKMAAAGARLLNDPTRSRLRLELLQALRERSINRFDVRRADVATPPERWPVLVRDARGFATSAPPLLHTCDEYRGAVANLAARGVPAADRICVEFLDTADAEGIYRKYGAFIVGDTIVPRHLYFSRNWFIKEADLADPRLLEEEMTYIDDNPHAKPLREIFRIARIAYGRVDYAMLDGRLQVWEINTNPVLTPRGEKIPARKEVHKRFTAMVTKAFLAVDPARS